MRSKTPRAALRLALAQISPHLGDLEANLAIHVRMASRARRAGARLLVFPELSLTGYALQDLAAEVALAAEDPRLEALGRASRGLALVAGFVERAPSGRIYNAAGVWERGRLAHVHRKAYLPTYGMFDEGRDFAPGPRLRAFDTSFGRVGILICEDLWHLSSSLVLALDGAELLIVISNSPLKATGRRGQGLWTPDAWLDLLRLTARFHTVWVAYANRVGFEEGWGFAGGSCVIDPAGTIVAREPEGDGEALVMANIDRAELARARAAFPLLRDERSDLVIRELQRIEREARP